MITFKDFIQLNSKMSRSDIIADFIKFAQGELQIESLPDLDINDDISRAKEMRTYGCYNPGEKTLWVYGKTKRNLGDLLRTLAHELTHHKQNLENRLYAEAGETGSDIENEANTQAAIIMRKYGQTNNGIYESIRYEDI